MKETKRVGITAMVSVVFARDASKENLEKYLDMNVQSAKGMYLRNHPGYRPISEPQFVTRQHPSREIDGEIIVDDSVWQYLYNFEVEIETK